MKAVFADTSFYAAWLSPRDAHHAKAAQIAANNPLTVVTTDFVVVELCNFFSKVSGRNIVAEFVESLREDPDTLVIPATSDLIQRGFDLFLRRPDKESSLTDCISFVVMEEHGIAEALTSDSDFEQAGFRALLAK